jgi:hypothetical protein
MPCWRSLSGPQQGRRTLVRRIQPVNFFFLVRFFVSDPLPLGTLRHRVEVAVKRTSDPSGNCRSAEAYLTAGLSGSSLEESHSGNNPLFLRFFGSPKQHVRKRRERRLAGAPFRALSEGGNSRLPPSVCQPAFFCHRSFFRRLLHRATEVMPIPRRQCVRGARGDRTGPCSTNRAERPPW